MLRLPLACSLHSTLINCNSIPIKSGDSQEVHFSNHRMEIVEQHWNEEKLNLNESVFVRSKVELDIPVEEPTLSFLDSLDAIKVPLLGSSRAAAMVIIVIIILIAAVKCPKGDTTTTPPIIVQNSASATPVVNTTPPPSSASPPPPYEAHNLDEDIKAFLAIPVLDRTGHQRETLLRHSMRKKTSLSLA